MHLLLTLLRTYSLLMQTLLRRLAGFPTATATTRAIRRCASSTSSSPSHPSSGPTPAPQSPVDPPLGPNDHVYTHVKNKNPMNLERMLIGYKPSGFPFEKEERSYWNKIELTVSPSGHTTASVKHWTGRVVCRASTKEYAIAKFLYNYTDAAALAVVAKVIAQRALETGVGEVYLRVGDDDMKKERMRRFVEAVRSSGLMLREANQFRPSDPHEDYVNWRKKYKPWEYDAGEDK